MWIASRYELGRRRYRVSSIMMAVILVVIAGAAITASLIIFNVFRGSPLPDNIAKNVDYVVFIPDDPWTFDKNSMTFNDKAKVLSITATNGNSKLSISQQLTPAQFIDVPQYFPTLLQKLGQYDSFGTSKGTVYLTHPQEFAGKTQAVLNENGTLLFAAPSNELTPKEWREFFNNLQIVK